MGIFDECLGRQNVIIRVKEGLAEMGTSNLSLYWAGTALHSYSLPRFFSPAGHSCSGRRLALPGSADMCSPLFVVYSLCTALAPALPGLAYDPLYYPASSDRWLYEAYGWLSLTELNQSPRRAPCAAFPVIITKQSGQTTDAENETSGR